MGEISSETRVHRELTRKKNGTYFLGKITGNYRPVYGF
jgi:hypothetical protein